MNNLSWFIYLTQVVDNLQGAASIALAVGGFVGVLAIPLGPILLDDFEIPWRKALWTFGSVMAVCGVVAIFTPTRQTMIMIAGSEIGERIAKSDDVKGVINPGMDLIRKWIKQEADKIKDKS